MVGRERLWDLLDDALSRPLTLISAPAGFGKTTLITSWLSERPRDFKVAWVSLDADDTDPAHFLYYLIASLQSVEPRVGRAPISLIGSLKIPSPRDLIALLLNELSQASDTILLVLDDYHLIRNADVDASLAYLVEQMPSTLRLIIATREEPGLPIARWRSLERVVEIGTEELRFSYEEAVVFFRQTMGLNIDSKSAHALEDRTEGWIAAMQMAALSLRLRGRGESLPETAESVAGFSGRHRYMVDYMAAEVLRRQSDDTRAFLHRTAVLDRLSAPLCDALTGRSDSKEVLARLEQSNMFLVPLDGDRTWYRYHQLFADFLRSALSAAEERELHQGASRWYEANGFGPEAIRHSLAASDVDGTVRLVRALAEETLSRGEFPTLLSWLSRLPESAFRSNSDLAGYKAWLLYMSGRSAEAETYATLAQPQGEAPRTPQQAGISLALRSFLALNWSEPQDTLPLARQALDELDDGTFFHAYALCLMGQAQGLTNDRRAAADTLRKAVERARRLGNHLMTLDSLAHLATIMNAQGKLREAIVLCRNAIDQYSDTADNPLPIAGLVCVPLGALLYETDDLPSARRYLTTGIELCGQLGMSYFKLVGLCALAKLQHACGERDEAWTTLAAAREISDRPQSPRRQRMATIATAELQLREANIEAAARTLESARSLLGAAFGAGNLDERAAPAGAAQPERRLEAGRRARGSRAAGGVRREPRRHPCPGGALQARVGPACGRGRAARERDLARCLGGLPARVPGRGRHADADAGADEARGAGVRGEPARAARRERRSPARAGVAARAAEQDGDRDPHAAESRSHQSGDRRPVDADGGHDQVAHEPDLWQATGAQSDRGAGARPTAQAALTAAGIYLWLGDSATRAARQSFAMGPGGLPMPSRSTAQRDRIWRIHDQRQDDTDRPSRLSDRGLQGAR